MSLELRRIGKVRYWIKASVLPIIWVVDTLINCTYKIPSVQVPYRVFGIIMSRTSEVLRTLVYGDCGQISNY